MATSDTDTKGVVMSAKTQTKELAARRNAGFSVVLRWHPREDAVTVAVADERTGDRFEIAVERECALDAFYHPYAYAA
jgi:hypothetical protein